VVPQQWMLDQLEAFKSGLELHGKEHMFLSRKPVTAEHTSFQRRLRAWLRRLPKPCGDSRRTDYITETALSAAVAQGYQVLKAGLRRLTTTNYLRTTRPSMSRVLPISRPQHAGRRAVAMKIDDPPRRRSCASSRPLESYAGSPRGFSKGRTRRFRRPWN
jgi:hypothetical protein